MPVFRSPLQALLLAQVLPQPQEDFTVSHLATALDADIATVSRETTRLVEAGVLVEKRVGRTRVLRANTSSQVYDELCSLAQKTFGVPQLALEAFRGLAGVRRVVIFGSWAARYHGERGPGPRDLDVLLVGQVSKVKAAVVAEALSARLALPVGLSFVDQQEWDTGGVNLVREIKRTHHLDLVAEDEL